MAFFNRNLVSFYTNEQAVIDKVNVGYDNCRIRTKLMEGGATGTDIRPLEVVMMNRICEAAQDRADLTARKISSARMPQ